MSAWLVGHLPSWLLLLGVIGVVAGTAVFAQIVVRRKLPELRGEEHNDVTHVAMVATLGVLVGTILFLVMMLSHPFVGEIATSAAPLREVIRALSVNAP